MQLYDNPEYDWCLKTIPQKNLNGRSHGWIRGKGLGGTSMINFQMFSQASKQDIDTWEALGNKGWGWDDIVPYYRKFETYHPPSAEASERFGASYVDESLRGKDGPIQVSFPVHDNHWLHQVWPATCQNVQYPAIPQDPRSGTSWGAYNQLTTIDPDNVIRSYAAREYYYPHAQSPNLHVVTGAQVSKINFEKNGNSEESITAVGVEFINQGKSYEVKARKEVILSAGVIHSPQILELSGIGGRDVLTKHGIEVLVDNSAGGENLQDHTAVPLVYEVIDGLATSEAFRDPQILAQAFEAYYKTKAGPLTGTITSVAFTPFTVAAPPAAQKEIQKQLEEKISATVSPVKKKELEIFLKQLLDPTEATFQYNAIPSGYDHHRCATGSGPWQHEFPGSYTGLATGSTRNLSRGYVHIQSPSVLDQPEIYAAYMVDPLDVEIAAYGVLHVRDIANTEPLASKFKDGENGKATPPGQSAPTNIEEARKHVLETVVSAYHPIGTCAMLPREAGGVVDTSLKVYGTKNVRVCDGSIFPTHIKGNMISLVYAVAEKAADIIKREGGLKA